VSASLMLDKTRIVREEFALISRCARKVCAIERLPTQCYILSEVFHGKSIALPVRPSL